MRQMDDDWQAETELSNALAEIRKYEKEMALIAMVAQTLVERSNDLQDQVAEQQIQITQHSTNEASALSKFQALQDEVQELRIKSEQNDRVRDEMSSRIKTLNERKQKMDKRTDELVERMRTLEDQDCKKD